MPKADPVKLDPNEILVAEFEYIAQTAFQANEDRARVASFYVVSVGSFIAAILGTQFLSEKFNVHLVHLAFGFLFLLLTILGYLTIVQLSKLRAAWHESALAMNQIKEYYITHLDHLDFANAFHWRTESLPDKDKPKSIAHLLAIEVALLSALTFGASTGFMLLWLQVDKVIGNWVWVFATALAFLAYKTQLQVFTKPLKNKEKK